MRFQNANENEFHSFGNLVIWPLKSLGQIWKFFQGVCRSPVFCIVLGMTSLRLRGGNSPYFVIPQLPTHATVIWCNFCRKSSPGNMLFSSLSQGFKRLSSGTFPQL